jgi:hypothetical protein
MQEIGGVDVTGYVGSDDEYMEGNLRYLREKYAIGFITLDELEIGLESVLQGGPVNVPQGHVAPDPRLVCVVEM